MVNVLDSTSILGLSQWLRSLHYVLGQDIMFLFLKKNLHRVTNVFLADHAVAMVTYCVTKMITT